MAALGNTSSQTIGLVTAGTEQLVGQASKVAKGLQTIGINLSSAAQQGNTLSISVGGVKKQIQLLSETGDTLSTFDILKQIAGYWGDMTDAEQTAVAEAQAGKTRFDVYAAVMSSFSDAIAANETAMNAQGSAARENAKYMESLQAKINALKNQFQELVLGEGGLVKVAKVFVDLGTGTLKYINEVGILNVAMTALGVTMVGKVVNNFEKISTVVAKTGLIFTKFVDYTSKGSTGVRALSYAIASYTGGAKSAAEVTEVLNATLAIAPWAALAITITAVSAAIALNAETAENLKKKIDNLSKSYSDLVSQRNELLSKTDLNGTEKERLILLNQEIEANKTLLQQEYEKASAYRDYEDTSGAVFENGTKHAKKDVSTTKGALNVDTEDASIKTMVEAYTQLSTAKANSLKQDEEITNKKAELLLALSQEAQLLLDAKEANGYLTDSDQKRLDSIEEITGKLSSQTDATQSLTDANEDCSESSDTAEESIKDLAKSVGMSSDELSDLANSMGLTADQTAEYVAGMNDFNDTMDGLQSAYSTLSDAVEEYNENGQYSWDTIQSLLEVNQKYGDILSVVNGQVVINEQAIRNKINAQAEEAKQTIYNTAIEKLNAIASGESGDASTVSANKKDNATTGIDSETNALTKNTKAKVANAAAEAITRGGQGVAGDVQKVLSDMKTELALVDSAMESLGKNFSGTMGKSASSSKSASKSSTDAWKEAYEDEKDALDHKLEMEEISQEDYYKQLYALNEKYFNDTSEHHKQYLDDYQKNEETMYKGVKQMLEDMADDVKDKLKEQEDAALDSIDIQIDAVNDAKDAALDAIDAQISAIKKEKEARLNAIDDELEALKTEQDAVETYWNNRIDAFKKANKELDKQNKLMEYQEALAKAQSTQVKIFQGGQFTYGQDQEAVDEAQENLDEYQDELKYEEELQALEDSRDAALAVYDQKIADLESYRDSVESYYESEIEAMEAHRDEVQEQYDAELEALETQKEETKKKYEEMIENYENTEKALFDTQVNAITSENQNWTVRLQNLADFVKNYNAMLSQLGSANTNVKSSYSGTSVKTKATGDSSINNSGAYIVGENPNKEIVIGSKLNNNGTLMNLSKGSGVVNAKSTSTLAGLLNNLGEISGIGATSNNNTTKSVNNNFNITANVQDGAGLVDYLQNFSSRMTQEAFAQ